MALGFVIGEVEQLAVSGQAAGLVEAATAQGAYQLFAARPGQHLDNLAGGAYTATAGAARP
ncbi:MAG: hypothetical protein R3D55_23315 [Chloroflexota bacterium]